MSELARRKILIVDDEPDLLDIMELYFQKQGAIVFRAKNGMEGLQIVLKEKPEFVLTDVIMPGKDNDGITLTRKIRETSTSLPLVIVITGFSHQSEEDAIKAGAIKVFSKPFNLTEIGDYVKELSRRLSST